MRNTTVLFFLLSISGFNAVFSQHLSKPEIVFFTSNTDTSNVVTSLSNIWTPLCKTSCIGLSLAALSYMAIWAKRSYNFYTLQQWLIQSSPIVKNSQYFRFSGWRMPHYPSGSAILNNFYKIHEELSNDIYNEKNKFFKDNTNKSVSLSDLKEENGLQALSELFIQEKSELENHLDAIAPYTPLTELIQKNCNPAIATNNRTVNNLILLHCQNIINNNTKLEEFENLLENTYYTTKNNLQLHNYFLARKPICIKKHQEKEIDPTEIELSYTFNTYSINPFTWNIGNAHHATSLYYNLLKRYLRLLALESIVNQAIIQNLMQQ